MGDNSISIVPKLLEYPDHKTKAKEILEWLVSLDIVKPVLSDCVLGAPGGYAISEGAKKITRSPEYLPFGLITNGLDIATAQEIFTGGADVYELICPACKQNIAYEKWTFSDESDDVKRTSIVCPSCNTESYVHQFVFSPEWGFSNLGFTFWNWADLSEDFINEFKARLGCDVTIVYEHI